MFAPPRPFPTLTNQATMANETDKYINQQEVQNEDDQLNALKRLSNALQNTLSGSNHLDPESCIVCGIDKLPLKYPDSSAPLTSPWNRLTKADLCCLKTFYSQRIPVQCRIRDCNAVPAGFQEVLHHRHVHRRKYTHMCIAPNCYVPFDKLGNAKRHVTTIHAATCAQAGEIRQRRSLSPHSKEVQNTIVEPVPTESPWSDNKKISSHYLIPVQESETARKKDVENFQSLCFSEEEKVNNSRFCPTDMDMEHLVVDNITCNTFNASCSTPERPNCRISDNHYSCAHNSFQRVRNKSNQRMIHLMNGYESDSKKRIVSDNVYGSDNFCLDKNKSLDNTHSEFGSNGNGKNSFHQSSPHITHQNEPLDSHTNLEGNGIMSRKGTIGAHTAESFFTSKNVEIENRPEPVLLNYILSSNIWGTSHEICEDRMRLYVTIPSKETLNRALSDVLPPDDVKDAMKAVLKKFPNLMNGNPPFSHVLSISVASALYIHFVRAVRLSATLENSPRPSLSCSESTSKNRMVSNLKTSTDSTFKQINNNYICSRATGKHKIFSNNKIVPSIPNNSSFLISRSCSKDEKDNFEQASLPS